jgi:hypothetical protein
MSVRTTAQLVLFALLASCGTETQPSPDATPSDAVDSASAVTEPAPSPNETTTSDDPAQDPEPGPLLLTPDGWGPLRIGMSRAQVVAAAGEDAHPDAVGGPDPEQCDEFRPRNAPDGVLVMIQNGFLTRISVSRNTDISTPAGFSVGDSGDAVVEEYGARAIVDPHEYQEPPARYITVWSQPDAQAERRGIRYETNADGNVAFLRGGGPSIEYVEGCA